MGHVGAYLLQYLHEAGAEVIVSDTDKQNIESAVSRFDVKTAGVDEIYDLEVDIYAPCAIGQTVNPHTLSRLKCAIIAGGANNQLTDASVYSTIEQKKIVYCPDFALNSGGVINVASELLPGGYQQAWTEAKVTDIFKTITRILDQSEQRKKFPELVALELAQERIEQVRLQKKAKKAEK